jgi:hypothetical protein
METTEYAWQYVSTVLMHFGKRKASAQQSTLHARGMDLTVSLRVGGNA